MKKNTFNASTTWAAALIITIFIIAAILLFNTKFVSDYFINAFLR